jgi:hypothetical protein
MGIPKNASERKQRFPEYSAACGSADGQHSRNFLIPKGSLADVTDFLGKILVTHKSVWVEREKLSANFLRWRGLPSNSPKNPGDHRP